jgi:EF-P beta-lysylation protein EpmB
MIPLKTVPWQSDAWTRALADAITEPRLLLERLALGPADVDFAPDFPLRVPLSFVDRMRPGDRHDPLLKQVLPTLAERDVAPGYSHDPLGEAVATRSPGVIQKYRGRVLLIAAPACAVHCRYCFRRTFPYDGHRQPVAFPSLVDVERDATISEVILSGGDPLMLKDAPLHRLIARIDAIAHVRRIRIHTRLPVVVPERATAELIALLRATRARTSIVLHVNHANEIAGPFVDALAALHTAGIALFNQSVLLAGVNDNVDALDELSQRLFDHHVVPYYLHLLDPVVGTHRFDVPQQRGVELVRALRDRLPGYLVPRLVREVAGLAAKQIIEST